MRGLAMSAEKESSDVPESLAGGSGTSGDDFDRRVKSLVEEILRGQTTRTPAPCPKIASIFKKMLLLKDLNRHLECTDVSFNPENVAFSKIKLTD